MKNIFFGKLDKREGSGKRTETKFPACTRTKFAAPPKSVGFCAPPKNPIFRAPLNWGNLRFPRFGRKGQMFLITGIFVLLILVLLRTETMQPGKGAFYAGLDWKKSFDNIENEYQKAADISLAQGKNEWNIEANLNNFSNFSVDSFSQRGYSMRVFYSLAFINTSNISVAVGNFQGSALKNISINLSSGQGSFLPSLQDRASNSSAFAPAANFSITVSYYLNETAVNFTYSADNNITSAALVALRLQQADSFADDMMIFNKTSGP